MYNKEFGLDSWIWVIQPRNLFQVPYLKIPKCRGLHGPSGATALQSVNRLGFKLEAGLASCKISGTHDVKKWVRKGEAAMDRPAQVLPFRRAWDRIYMCTLSKHNWKALRNVWKPELEHPCHCSILCIIQSSWKLLFALSCPPVCKYTTECWHVD